MSINSCVFSGRLTRDCEVKTIPNGSTVLEFGLAVNKWDYKENKETAFFINCFSFRDAKIAPHLTKGKAIMVQGSYSPEEFQGNDGQMVKLHNKFRIFDIQFQQGDPKNQQQQPQQQPQYQQPPQTQQPQQQYQQPPQPQQQPQQQPPQTQQPQQQYQPQPHQPQQQVPQGPPIYQNQQPPQQSQQPQQTPNGMPNIDFNF
jgi:single stranded DNA-binding protein